MFMTLVTVYNLDNVITQEALMSRMYIRKEAISLLSQKEVTICLENSWDTGETQGNILNLELLAIINYNYNKKDMICNSCSSMNQMDVYSIQMGEWHVPKTLPSFWALGL